MKKLTLGKLKLQEEEILERSELGSIYGGSGSGSPSSYCISLYVVRACNSLDMGSQTGWNYGWAAGSCNNNGMSGEYYYSQATNAGYNMSNCSNFL